MKNIVKNSSFETQSQHFLFLFVSLVLLSASFITHAKELTLPEMINKAGLQRMLSQRMAKNYILLSQHISTEKAADELDESAAIFEENLHYLSLYVKKSERTKSAQLALKELKKTWYGFRTFVFAAADKNKIVTVVNKSTDLLKAAHILVLTLESTTHKTGAHIINISGRQRMLSQRLAMFYFASHALQQNKTFKNKMEETANEFTLALNELNRSKLNTDEIKEALANVNSQWSFYKTKFVSQSQARFSPRTIFVVTESLLKDMNDITKLYEVEGVKNAHFSTWITG